MKATESKTATQSSHAQQQPFFQQDGESPFFGGEQVQAKANSESFQGNTPFSQSNGNSPFFSPLPIQAKLKVGRPGDKYEREADHMADKVVQQLSNPISADTSENGAPISSVGTTTTQPKCAECTQEEKLQKQDGEEELSMKGEEIQRKPIFESEGDAPVGVQRKCADCGKDISKPTLQTKSENQNNHPSSSLETRLGASKGKGQPLSKDTQTSMESSFDTDFSGVRVHTGSDAVQMSSDLGAQAFTHGSDIYFNKGKYDSGSSQGKHLLAHELTHTVQQGGGNAESAIQRQTAPSMLANSDFGLSSLEDFVPPEMTSPLCPIPSYCPSFFCSPYPSRTEAQIARDLMADVLLFGISQRINSRVVPFWRTYIYGGSGPLNVKSLFETDFTNSATTKEAVDFLFGAIKREIIDHPPSFPSGHDTVTIDISTIIPDEITALGDPGNSDHMNFDKIGEVPGNLVGGIGADQTTYPIGARPSPFNDFRGASGQVKVTRLPNGALRIVTEITFIVRDTIDFCPGDCGADQEQLATVPLSMFEASGISGDVPISIEYPAPSIPPYKTSPGLVDIPSVKGKINARAGLRIRSAPNSSSSILGHYSYGRKIKLSCKVKGEEINGEDTWYKTNLGYISGAYVIDLDGTSHDC